MLMKKINIKGLALVALLLMMILPAHASDLSEEDSRKFDYYFIEACRLKMQGNFPESGEMFKNCLQVDETSAVAHFEFGKLLLMTGDENNAITFLKQAFLLNPTNEWYQVYLAGVFEHAKKGHQAIAIYEGLKNQYPAKLEYYYHLGDLYTTSNQYLKAVEVYDAIEKQEGVDEALTLEKQRLYLLAGEKKKALAEVMSLVNEHPKEARYLLLLGDYYLAIEDLKKAKKAYDKASVIDNDNGYLHLSLSNYFLFAEDNVQSQEEMKLAFASPDVVYEQKMQILLRVMMTAAQDTSFTPIVEELTELLKDTHPDEASTYFFYANLFIEDTTKRDIVIENLEQVVTLDPSNEEAWMQLIRLSFDIKDFEQVIAYTDDALLSELKTSYIYFYRGIAAQQQKDYTTAQEAFANGVEVTPDDNGLKPQLLGSLGDIYYELKDAPKAFENYEAALALDNNNVMVMNNYAYYLSEHDTLLARAETMSAHCIDLEPGNPTYLDTYAWILYKRNNLLLAKFYMEKAIHNIGEENDVLYDHYAEILYANDEKEEAIEFWQKSIDAGGDENAIMLKINQ
jgi:tetratricopeptide (TPR) repeat protein